jgi:hypothetical protein
MIAVGSVDGGSKVVVDTRRVRFNTIAAPLVAVTEKLEDPVAEVVPLMRPAGERERPAGSDPVLIAHVAAAPTVESEYEYGTPDVASGSALVLEKNPNGATVSVNARTPMLPTVSVAMIVKLWIPAVVANPTRFEPTSANPGGSDVRAVSVCAPVPPDVLMAKLPDTPCCDVKLGPLLNDRVGPDAAPAMFRLTLAVMVLVALSVAVTSTVKLPVTPGVPLMTPADEFRLSPSGMPTLDQV